MRVFVYEDLRQNETDFLFLLSYVLFFIATVSIFYGVWKFFRTTNGNIKVKNTKIKSRRK